MNKRLTIAFLDEDAYDEYHNMLAEGIAAAAREYQADVIRIGHFMVHFTTEKPLQINNLQQLVSQFHVDGLLLLGWARGAREHERAGLPAGLPMVSIGSSQSGIPGIVFAGDHYIRELTTHLAEQHNCRHIAFIDPFWPDNRSAAYRDVLEQHQIYDPLYHVEAEALAGLSVRDRGRRAIELLLDDRGIMPDAIMSLTNEESFEIIETLAERNIRVPEDIVVTSYEDGDIGRFSRVSLTTVDFPWYELGYLSASKLFRQIRGDDQEPLIEYVPGRVIYRDSCGCLPFGDAILPVEHQLTSDNESDSDQFIGSASRLTEDTPFSPDSVDRLIRQFRLSLDQSQQQKFLLAYERFLHENEPRLFTPGLRSFAVRFRREILSSYMASDDLRQQIKADDLCHQMQLILQNWLATTRFRQDIKYRYQHTTLKEVGQILITNFEKDSLYRSLNNNLPRIGVRACQIFLFEGSSHHDLFKHCHLSYSWSADGGQSHDLAYPLQDPELMRQLLFPNDTSAFLLTHFLNIGEHFSGFIIIEPEHLDIRLYRSLALHISSTLHEISLFERLNGSYHQLMEQAHRRGVEDTSAILHNIANLMNTVNLMAQSMQNQARESGLPDLKKANQVLRQKIDNLEDYVRQDPASHQLMQFYAALGTQVERFKTEISTLSSRLEEKIRLIEEIVQSQTDLAETAVRLEAVDVVQLLEDVLEMYQKTLQRREISLTRRYRDPVEVLAHKTRLFHVLTNVIKNAIESIEEGNRDQRELTITVQREPDRVLVRIEDSGQGIAPDQMDRIFGYGFSTKESGHGFGLHSCANYMTEMKGRIWAENAEKGGGAVFSLRFRLTPAE